MITYPSPNPTDQHRRVTILAPMTQASGTEKNSRLVEFIFIEKLRTEYVRNPDTHIQHKDNFFSYHNGLGGIM